jgi:hypothetical protein
LRTPAFLIAAGALFISAAASAASIGYDGARHLLTRTGFGATDEEVRAFAGLERGAAVDRGLRPRVASLPSRRLRSLRRRRCPSTSCVR